MSGRWNGLFCLILVSLLLGAFGGCSAARVQVESTPRGAAVFVDDSAVGTTPWVGNLSKGFRTFRIEQPGFRSVVRSVPVQATWARKYVVPALFIAGLGMGTFGMVRENLSIQLGGLGTSLVGLVLMSNPDTILQVSLNGMQANEDPRLVVGVRTMHKVPVENFQFPGREKLVYTDSVCWEKARKTLWIHDVQKQVQYPIAGESIQRCDPNEGVASSRPSYLTFWGLATATFFGVFAVAGSDDVRNEPQEYFVISALLGGLVGWVTWVSTPDYEICKNILDPITTRDWLEEYPCYPASTSVKPLGN